MLKVDPSRPALVLGTVGVPAFWCGSILPSRFLAESLYGYVLSWDAGPPDDWRRRATGTFASTWSEAWVRRRPISAS